MRRRLILTSAAALAIVAAGAGGFIAYADASTASAPWRDLPDRTDDPRLFALAHAILAPNPHNRQPWTIDLIGDDQALLFCDLDRRLPQTDPFDRQITIGLGAFLELAQIAAAEIGHELLVSPFPQGEPFPRLDHRSVALLQFVAKPSLPKDKLFAQIVGRRSLKEPFDTARPVPRTVLQAVLAEAGGVGVGVAIEPAEVAALRAIHDEAVRIEVTTPRTAEESIALIRIGRSEVLAQPDGIDLSGPLLEGLRLAGVLTREAMRDPGSTATAQMLQGFREMSATAMGWVWIVTPGNGRIDQLQAGATCVRLNLAATGHALGWHPMSQSLQEFAEMAPSLQALHDVLAVSAPARIQMLCRIGYGPTPSASPRWPLTTRIRSS